MEDKNGYSYQGSGLWRSLRDGDFEESDMWDVLDDKRDYSPRLHCTSEPAGAYSSRIPRYSAAEMVPRASSGSSSGSTPEPKIIQQSAPVNVPNWSHIKRRNAKSKKAFEKPSRRGNDSDGDDETDDNDVHEGGGSDGDEDENDHKMPPHEFIASRLARSHISSFSVFEGVGRTLKGRDLSKVRNAVLTKTGFLESP
ncbi:uncharacterized protein LOC115735544 [Rhodamnia argentea]|uniref:Uncharacterized protein LOC115735544 n=1 Tax=Rhodamnia argentea TaxID=178133 RepID=A0A8B8NJN0_9MYRT|nr:uncharacterized protein LOC115735544 [Rhodamnia argentea]XP_048130960.1 uncharacterized protein LOC115735544 [Rhodamnia argentea]XP_048130961.1 uncharacterized protein LOC115735544 [Rhodamnia argentea]XP_048130962.1 uncharacterized protein LOC115735544 [Rhodamnia argentea]XP_048130963.1 uncharacterized protein LOC115735544 [Rhodamnia argentea]